MMTMMCGGDQATQPITVNTLPFEKLLKFHVYPHYATNGYKKNVKLVITN